MILIVKWITFTENQNIDEIFLLIVYQLINSFDAHLQLEVVNPALFKLDSSNDIYL